jgi:hypothetical protein
MPKNLALCECCGGTHGARLACEWCKTKTCVICRRWTHLYRLCVVCYCGAHQLTKKQPHRSVKVAIGGRIVHAEPCRVIEMHVRSPSRLAVVRRGYDVERTERVYHGECDDLRRY